MINIVLYWLFYFALLWDRIPEYHARINLRMELQNTILEYNSQVQLLNRMCCKHVFFRALVGRQRDRRKGQKRQMGNQIHT